MIHSASSRHHGHEDGRATGSAGPSGRGRRIWGLLKQPSRRAGLGLAAMIGLAGIWVVASRFRDRPAMPRRAEGAPPPPKLDAQIASAAAQLKDNSQDLAAMVRLGVLYFEKGKGSYVDAINTLEEARSLGALDARIFYCLGIMYQELGFYPFALEEYQRFLRNRPQDKEVRLLLAKLFYHEGRFRDAADEYERLKFLHSQDQVIEENLGLSLLKAKEHARAAESFQKLKAFGGDAAKRAAYYAAQLDCEQGRFNACLAGLRPVLPWDSSLGIPAEQAYALAASAAEKLKLNDEAREYWEKVVSLAPNDAKARSSLKQLVRRSPPKKKKKP